MKHFSIPFYQSMIRRIPYIKNQAAEVLNFFCRSKVVSQVNSFKMKLDLCECIQREMFYGNYEPEQTKWFKQYLCPGDVVVDIGANFGWYTTLAASLVGLTGKVFAFEPSPIAGQVVETMIKDAMLQNTILTKAAVGDSSGNVSIFLPTIRYCHSPSVFQSDPSFVPFQVPVIALDDFMPLKDIAKIKLVKIDVEGYEPNVLAGMESLIKNNRIENIICEFNSGWLRRNSINPEQLHERFLDFGYRVNMQTKLEKDCVGHLGECYDLQDKFYSRFSRE